MVPKKTGGHFCSHCGKAVQTLGELNRHIATAHEGVTYDCHLCGKCYKTKQGMYKSSMYIFAKKETSFKGNFDVFLKWESVVLTTIGPILTKGFKN